MSEVKTLGIDEKKSTAFFEKVFEDIAGAYVSMMCSIGDNLHLFKAIKEKGPATSDDLAKSAGINERYMQEWLNVMACAGYLEYDPSNLQFRLPLEHEPVLTQEGGPMFLAGIYQQFLAETKNTEKLIQKFKRGGGIPLNEFDQDEFIGMERMTASWFENLLLQEWIPAVPDVKAKLEKGASVADIGCGRGRAIFKLAKAFPKSQFVGYDIVESVIEFANSQSISQGVSDRVTFKKLDISKGIPEVGHYDVITTFDVIHDMADPVAALKAIHDALKDDGTYLWLEINSKDKLEDNIGTVGALLYSWSIAYCMTTSLAEKGKGIGTLGMPMVRVEEYCKEAGFSHMRKLPVDNPFNVLYEIKH